MKRARLPCMLPLLFTTALFAHSDGSVDRSTGTIHGIVTSKSTNEPVIGANVLLLGTVLGSATDTDGRFEIRFVPEGTYTLMVTAIGYKKEEQEISVRAEETIELKYEMEETVLMLDGVAVTASRSQQSLDDIPMSLSLIPATDIMRRNIVSVDQALRYVPGVNALERGQISIRGSSGFNMGMGSRVLVLLNGNPMMSTDNWDVNWYAVPISNIRQIEVLKGAGSALYGSSAMGGVVNIITEEPEEGTHIHVRSYAGIYNKPSHLAWRWTVRNRHFEGTAVDLSSRMGPVSASVSANLKNTTGYRESDDHHASSFLASIGAHLTKTLRFDLMAGAGRDKGGFFIYWKGLDQPYLNGSDPYGFRTLALQKRMQIFPSLSYVLNNRIFISMKGRYLASSTEDRLESKISGVPSPDDRFRYSDARTMGGEIQVNFQVSPQGIMVMGGDFQGDEVDSRQFGHREVARASYYLQLEQRFWGALKATIGMRWDGEKIQGLESTGQLSRKLGLNMSFNETTHLRFSYGEGFRIPAIGERFVSTITSGLKVSPNPELLPEESNSAEIGLKKALSKTMHLDLAFFYNGYSNLIEPQLDTDPDGSVVIRFKNVSKARIRGLDLSHRTDWWSRLFTSRIGYTYIDADDHSPGEEHGKPLKYRSRHTLYINGELNILPFTLSADFRYLSKIERVDAYHRTYIKDIDRVVPTYVLSLRGGVQFPVFSVYMLVDNVFQYNYLSAPANIGPPRTMTLQVNVRL